MLDCARISLGNRDPEDVYKRQDGKSIQKALDFITPYRLDKSSWPYPPDVMHFEAFPARAGFMMFAGCALGREELLNLYDSLPAVFFKEQRRGFFVLSITSTLKKHFAHAEITSSLKFF